MGIERIEKAKLIVGLVFKHMIEEGLWSVFTKTLWRECMRTQHIDLGFDFGTIGLEKAVERLVSRVGDQRSVLLAYRSEELLLGMGENATDYEDPSSRETEEALTQIETVEEEEQAGNTTSTESEEQYYDVPDSWRESDLEHPVETVQDASDDTASESQEVLDGEENAEKESPENLIASPEKEVSVSDTNGDDTEAKEVVIKESDEKDDAMESPDVDDPEKRYNICSEPNFQTHINRMASLLKGALADSVMPDATLSIEEIERQLEHFIFNPPRSLPMEGKEVRHNFYPPFVTPKAICNYHIFTMTTPIPKSCKANRYGTEVFEKIRNSNYYRRLPKWRVGVVVEDGLGDEVTPIGELQEEVKMIPLQSDIARLQWVKARSEHVVYFGYPSLHFPPKISKMLMETLLQKFSEEGQPMDDCKPAVSDLELCQMVDPMRKMSAMELSDAIGKKRAMMMMSVRMGCQLELMERVFREPSMIKKINECLHHTFHHGYVNLIRDVAKVNLSNYVTYHGITYNNPLNNCIQANLLDGIDREDFIVDSIYLFLVLAWQTAMGMWNQAVEETTVAVYADVFSKLKREIYSQNSVTDMSKLIVDILMDGDRLVEEMRKSLPNFTSLSQISAFRNFLMERSNLPSVAVPVYPSDMIPLVYKQATGPLWDQVYLLQTAYFLMNHGGYTWEPELDTAHHKAYCPCNLCSPHRMPHHNQALHNEILAIGTFEIQNADGKTFKLTPELWTNAYLDKFVAEDYHPFHVVRYREHESSFSANRTACVTQSPEIFSLIKHIQKSREEFIRTKGKGVYKDPQTGEEISSSSKAGCGEGPAIPAPIAHKLGGAEASEAPPKPVRTFKHGSTAGGRVQETNGNGGAGDRWGVDRQSGYGVCRQRGGIRTGVRRGGGSQRFRRTLSHPSTPIAYPRRGTAINHAKEKEAGDEYEADHLQETQGDHGGSVQQEERATDGGGECGETCEDCPQKNGGDIEDLGSAEC